MDQRDWLSEQFETNRVHLRSVAYRMLGSLTEADDAVQESWIRLSRSDTSDVRNLGGWLTTVIARVCLDMLRARKTRPEPTDSVADIAAPAPGGVDPEHEALLADAVGPALLVVLETLSPAERLAFVLHDLFGVPFDDIAPIVGRTPTATRQLASRARRRVQGGPASAADRTRQQEVVEAFLAASRNGDFDALVALLDPDVVLRADAVAVQAGATDDVRGAAAVAGTFAGRAKAAQPVLIDGDAGLVFARGGQPQVVFAFTLDGDRIVEIEMVADRARLDEFRLELLP